MPTASSYQLMPTLVRGLDYYTRTTFEFKDEAIGAKDTICGGGRYDGLIEEIGGPPTPGIGFGAGIERLLLSIGAERAEPPHIDVFFVLRARTAIVLAILPLLAELRAAGCVPTWTTRAARPRVNSLRPRDSARGWTVLVEGDEATVRQQGREDFTAPLDEVVDRIAG